MAGRAHQKAQVIIRNRYMIRCEVVHRTNHREIARERVQQVYFDDAFEDYAESLDTLARVLSSTKTWTL